MRKPREYHYWLPDENGVYDWRPDPTPETPSLYSYLAGRTEAPRGFRKARVPSVVTAVRTTPTKRVLHIPGEVVRGRHSGREVLAARFECGAYSVHVRPASPDEGLGWCKRCHAIQKSEYSVYAYWANDGAAVYVGQTSNWNYRHRQHQASSAWYPLVAWYSVLATYDNRKDALAHEKRLIRQETPAFNVQGNPAANRAA